VLCVLLSQLGYYGFKEQHRFLCKTPSLCVHLLPLPLLLLLLLSVVCLLFLCCLAGLLRLQGAAGLEGGTAGQAEGAAAE
jgi:hypothetical protein